MFYRKFIGNISEIVRPMINRFSSLRQKIDQSFLTDRLRGAKKYDRIAGYFSSSVLEVAGEAIESMEGPVTICYRCIRNSQRHACSFNYL